jgi:hypothetical protein
MTLSHVTAEEEGGCDCEGVVRIERIAQQYDVLTTTIGADFRFYMTKLTVPFVIKIERDCGVNLALRVDRSTVNQIISSAFLFCHVSHTLRTSRKVTWVDDSVT